MIYLQSEPHGDDYLRLLGFLKRYSSSFELVLHQTGLRPKKRAKAFAAELRPFQQSCTETAEWAGTKLGPGAGMAAVARYVFEPGSLTLLASAERLYAWCLPDLPEDLAFYDEGGTCVFSSTAHEREAIVLTASISSDEFAEANPGLSFTWYPGGRVWPT